MKTLAFFFALISSALAEAPVKLEPIKVASLVVNGREYKDASIIKFNVSVCRVVHSKGAARIPMNLLSAELQKKLGYDPEEERLEAEIAEKVAREKMEAKMKQDYLDRIPVRRFWVSENTEKGLIVGNFVSVTEGGGASTTSMGRAGGGGYSHVSSGRKVWERDYKYSFIPHTEETKSLACDFEFEAKIRINGTIRIDEETVLENLEIIKFLD